MPDALFESFGDIILGNLRGIDSIGLAHGKSGICLALACIYAVTKSKEAFAQMKIELQSEFNLTHHNEVEATWCNGMSGLLLARTTIASMLQEDDYIKTLDIQINGLLDICCDQFFSDVPAICLCHGVYGNYEVIRSIREYNEKLQKIYENMTLPHISDLCEYEWFSGIKFCYESFMLGASGVAYTFLRENGGFPSILSLEIYN